MEQEILKAIKEDRLYDFVANNYYRISQETLRDLILEIYYVFRYETSLDIEEEFIKVHENLIESLKENRDWEE